MADNNSYDIISTNRKLKTIFLLLFFSCLVGVFFIYRYYLWPFIFAVFFYIAFKPFQGLLIEKIKNRSLVTLIIVIIFLLLVIVPLFILLISLANQSYDLYNIIVSKFNSKSAFSYKLSDYAIINDLLSYLNITEAEVYNRVVGSIQKTSFKIFTGITDFIGFSITIVVNFFFMILILTFLLQEGDRFSASIYRILPFPDDIEEMVYNRLREVIKVLVAGNIFIMILQGLMVGVGYAIVGIDLALIAFAAAFILSLIPVIGTSFLWIPAAVYLFVTGQYWQAVFISVWCLSWYLILENLLKPALFGKKLRFHPLLFFFLLLGSLKTFGLPGVIVGPVILTIFFSLWEIYKILDIYDLEKTNKD